MSTSPIPAAPVGAVSPSIASRSLSADASSTCFFWVASVNSTRLLSSSTTASFFEPGARSVFFGPIAALMMRPVRLSTTSSMPLLEYHSSASTWGVFFRSTSSPGT